MGYVLSGWMDEILDFIGINGPRLDGGDQPGPWRGVRRAVASRRGAPWGFSRMIVPMG